MRKTSSSKSVKTRLRMSINPPFVLLLNLLLFNQNSPFFILSYPLGNCIYVSWLGSRVSCDWKLSVWLLSVDLFRNSEILLLKDRITGVWYIAGLQVSFLRRIHTSKACLENEIYQWKPKKQKQKNDFNKGFQVITRLYFHFAKFLHQSQPDELLWEGETKQKTVLNRVSPKKL